MSIYMYKLFCKSTTNYRYVKKRRDDSYFHTCDALHAGSSADVKQTVVPVGKSGKVTIKETRKSEITMSDNSSSTNMPTYTSQINFNGSFNQCTFNFTN